MPVSLCLAPSGLTIAFPFTQGVARLRRTCPGLVYGAPSGLTLHNKTFVKPTRKIHFSRFGTQGACHMPFEYKTDDFLRWFGSSIRLLLYYISLIQLVSSTPKF